MKALLCALVSVLILDTSLVHAQVDAATEVLEGDVDHWIEYYKKERGQVEPAPSADEEGPSRTRSAEPDAYPSRPDQAAPGAISDSVQPSASDR